MKSRRTMDLTNGSVTKKLLIFVYPLLITNLLQQFYQIADHTVVGRYVGSHALAAVGATGTATSLVLNMIIGLAVGAGIVNANLLGANKKTALRNSLHTTMLVALIGGLFFSALGILVAKPMLQLMDCNEKVIDDAALYMRIIFCGTPGTMLYNFGSGILRTHGDSKRPMIIMMVCGLINVVLNFVFVCFFHMSVDGVALSTIISKYVSAVWVLIILFNPKGDFKLSLKEIKFRFREIWSIVKVGVPCGINGLVFGISNFIVTKAINNFGLVEMSGSAVASNMITILYQILIAFYSACVSFSGQCYGAGKLKRITRLMVTSVSICVGVLGTICLLFTFFPDVFLGFLVDKEEEGIELILRSATNKLLIMSWSYILYAISEIVLGCLRGMRRTTWTTAINIFCVCVIRLLWIFIVCPIQPDNPMLLYTCYPVSYICSLSALFIYFIVVYRKTAKKIKLSGSTV